jgi:hypothetical protein
MPYRGPGPLVLGIACGRFRADARKRRLVFGKWSCCLWVLLSAVDTCEVELESHSVRLRLGRVTAITHSQAQMIVDN